MAFRDCFSFDNMATADLTRTFTSVSSMIINASGRFGSCAAQGAVAKTYDAQDTWIVGVAVYITSSMGSDDIIRFQSVGTNQVQLTVNTDGTLSVRRGLNTLGTTTYALSTATWYYIEFKATIDNTNGSYEVRVDSDSKLSATGADTQSTASATANGVVINSPNTGYKFDDMYVLDGSGGSDNDFWGDVRVECLLADGDSTANDQWTLSAGTDTYALIDDTTPDDDSTYIHSDTAGHKTTCTFQNLSYTDGAIKGLKLTNVARKDSSGARTICPVIRSSGADYEGSNVSLNNTYTFHYQLYATNPATSTAWTILGVEDAEFGVKLVS